MILIIANFFTDWLGITKRRRKATEQEQDSIREARRHDRSLIFIQAGLLKDLERTALKEIDKYVEEMTESGMAAHMQLTPHDIGRCKHAVEDKIRDLRSMPLKERLVFYQGAQSPGSYGMHRVIPSNIPFGPPQKKTIEKLIETVNERIMWSEKVTDIEEAPDRELEEFHERKLPKRETGKRAA